MSICIVVGARPNFVKVAAIIEAIHKQNRKRKSCIRYFLVHTGQHYDLNMSNLFFEDLELPEPEYYLGVRSGSPVFQTAEIMQAFERVCIEAKPTHVLVVGDVTSTLACALVASKNGIRVIHVEAGLRSFDRSMPEEINRVLTDAVSDILFTTEESANENLLREGISAGRIHFVGNVMIDTLKKHYERARNSDILQRLHLEGDAKYDYGVMTLHRSSNVDGCKAFMQVVAAVLKLSEKLPIVFPVHPRTRSRIEEYHVEDYFTWHQTTAPQTIVPEVGIYCIDPLGYLDFLRLIMGSRVVLTDSGGIQEETTALGVPCVTLRDNTERPATVVYGTNTLAGVQTEGILKAFCRAMAKDPSSFRMPPLWDGTAAQRIAAILAKEV